ncbi:unnamed protein product [Durusdinium trenchii]|uniref:Uncharacterized protein n=2 Tax=Durusdinium trenchii TaxID=1381693 RepID=A0ABP0HXI4_9DINO
MKRGRHRFLGVFGHVTFELYHVWKSIVLLRPSRIPGAGPEWLNATPIFVTTVKSDQVQGKIIECEVDLRKTPLVPLSQVYFSVKARYLSLPLETNFSVELSQSMPAVAVPSTGADAKDVQQMP